MAPAVNLLDLALIALIVLAALSGYRRGALLQILTFGGLLVGLLVGAVVAPKVAGLVRSGTAQTVVALVTFLACAAAGDILGWLVGSRVWAVTRSSRLAAVDSFGGSVVAVCALLLAIWFVALNLAGGPFPALSRQIGGSAVVRGLDSVLPEPPSLLGGVRRFVDEFGFPEVFAGLPPEPGGPVQGPTGPEASRAFHAAAGSTLRVVGEACGRIQEGSGFVASPGYVVTNAHVVAGVGVPRVQGAGIGTEISVPVWFDPQLDVAVLRVPTTPAPLPLANAEVPRGAVGAVVGYPGGGGLIGRPAANRRVLHAVGRDIYGSGTVIRDIYELQATVRPGNSGGPFVLVNGRVGGMVFAASTTDADVGYAITSMEIAKDMQQAIGRSDPVSTGPCVG